jgi:signal peptidase I
MLELKKSEYRENIESFAISVLTIVFIMTFVARSYLVQGSSMEPTLFTGERLIVNRLIFKIRPPKTGDIVVIIPPGDPTRKYIKRVIAGPSQSINIQNSKVYVSGEELREPYIKEKTFSNYDQQQVPDKAIFVMGDNRNNSSDSRSSVVGFVPLENVIGKAIFIFWPIPKIKILFNPIYKPLKMELPKFRKLSPVP